MANVTIAGNSYVVTSAVSMADLETVKKYRPSALTIIDPDTKETLFKVGISSGVAGSGSANSSGGTNGSGSAGVCGISSGSISDYGISFGGVSNDAAKLATATLPIPHDVKDAKEYVLDKAGLALVNLEKIEAEIAEALDEIRAERSSIAESIKVSV